MSDDRTPIDYAELIKNSGIGCKYIDFKKGINRCKHCDKIVNVDKCRCKYFKKKG